MPYANLGDYRLYYEEYGVGEPVIFLHGFTLDIRMWTAQAEFLESDYHVILLDAKGHGLSDAPETGYSRADRVEDLRRFVDSLGIDRFHLVGLSMGGSTGIGFALKYPERLLSLTLASAGAAGWDVGKKISHLDTLARAKGLEATREEWKQMSLAWYKDDREDIRQLMEEMIDHHSGAVWMDPMRGKYPRTRDLDHVQRISVPTLILVGELDRVFVPLARELHKKIRTSELKIYENTGHMLNLEAPDRFNGDIKAFLDAHSE